MLERNQRNVESGQAPDRPLRRETVRHSCPGDNFHSEGIRLTPDKRVRCYNVQFRHMRVSLPGRESGKRRHYSGSMSANARSMRSTSSRITRIAC